MIGHFVVPEGNQISLPRKTNKSRPETEVKKYLQVSLVHVALSDRILAAGPVWLPCFTFAAICKPSELFSSDYRFFFFFFL